MKNNSNFKIKFGYSSAQFFISWPVKMETTFFIFFLTNVAMLSTASMTKVTSFGSTFIAISTLLFGILIQKANFKAGKYRPWLVITAVLMFFGRCMQFTTPGFGEAGLIIWFMIGYLIANFAFSGWMTSYIALIPAIATETQERTQLNSMRNIGNSVGQFLFSSLAVTLIGWFSVSSEKGGYSTMGILTAVFTLVAMIIAMRATKTVPDKAASTTTEDDKNKVGLLEMLKYAFININSIKFILFFLCMTAASMINNFTAAYYYEYVANSTGLLTLYLSLSTLFSIGGAFFSPFFCKLVKGSRNATAYGMIIYGACFVLAFFLKGNAVMFTIMLSIAYCMWAVVNTSNLAVWTGVVEYTQLKSGKDLRGFMMSIWSLTVKIGIILATTTLGLSLGAIGFEAKNVTASAIAGIPIVVVLIPAIFAVVGGLIARTIQLNDTQIKEIQDEIAAKEA